MKCRSPWIFNNEGIRFDAGLIETAINAEPAIEACGLAPMYDKLLHDTVPVLYVQTNVKGKRGEEAVKDAIKKVFVTDGKQKESNLPIQCVITDKIPYRLKADSLCRGCRICLLDMTFLRYFYIFRTIWHR